MPHSGHAMETFVVNGVHFAYSDFSVQAAFHQTSSYGGPIREGLPIRLHYIGPQDCAEILQLEIAR
jgi:hypothetical protein